MSCKYLSRLQSVGYLAEKGVPVSKNTLDKYATVGGGPRYRKFGIRVLYTPEDLDSWVEEKLSKPRKSTSEAA